MSEMELGIDEGEFFRCVFRYGILGFGIVCITSALSLKLAIHYRPIVLVHSRNSITEMAKKSLFIFDTITLKPKVYQQPIQQSQSKTTSSKPNSSLQ